MEYSYTDIEARVRAAQKMRSDALGEILASTCTRTAQFFKGLIRHKLHPSAAAVKSAPAHSY